MTGDIENLIETIKLIQSRNQFKNYIDYIQFPFYRNLELDQRINFSFPLTVFVGPNGSGKSSTLHAIQGCPEGYTPYKFWFSTALDPVVDVLDSRKLRHSFFYGYKDPTGVELQVAKARIKRKNNPNYWETSRPLISYGMNPPPEGRERNDPITKNVVHIDFRSILSAFDKYFYFETPSQNLAAKTKQEYLRTRSERVKKIFSGEHRRYLDRNSNEFNSPVVELIPTELSEISRILGKEYVEGKILRHRLFHNWGDSVLLKTNFHTYSEAFAGSGEMSVVMLVRLVLQAEEYSLIVLDEPEVSLHPGAQTKLKLFLLDQIKKKKHQIVISTHSASLIEGLPKEAIKVFFQKEDSGKFIVKENISPEEAFYFIGKPLDEKTLLVVEDKLAKKIIDKVLTKLGPEVKNRFQVQAIPGGAETISKHYIPIYCNTNNARCFFLLDGDKKRVEHLFETGTLQAQDENEAFLSLKIKEQTGCDIKFLVDGNTEGGNVGQRITMMIDFLKYYGEHVRYFPQKTPEDIIWYDQVVEQKLNKQDYEQNIDQINLLRTSKQKIFETAKIFFGVDTQIDAFEDMLINEWIRKEDENYVIIKSIIELL